jgi:ABC-type transporter Mla subunit MlaD
MVTIQHGTVTVSIPDEFAPPAQAGNLGPEEVRRIAKAPRGIGLVCDAAADALEKSGTKFAAPLGVVPASLRALGKRAEGIDQVILDLDVVLNKLKQANLLFDAEAWEQIRKVNDQVKAQGKHDPEVLVMFKPVLDFFAHARPAPAPAPAPQPAVR